jgi:RNA polymerase sigma-70 factor (ECF subfamily)
MSIDELRTTDLHGWVGRLRAGDRAAADELLRACRGRLEELTRRMLRRERSRRWVETGEVFNGAALRLLDALGSTSVADTREFFNLAAAMIRRELIDLARHYYGPRGLGANHHSAAPRDGGPPVPDPADPGGESADLDRWAAFHHAVERLPVAEREVFSLVFYHGWSKVRVAELLGVTDRTVRTIWGRAAELLDAALAGDLPVG